MAPPDYNESIPKTKLNMKRTFSFLTALLAIVSMMLCCNNCSKDDSGGNDTGKAYLRLNFNEKMVSNSSGSLEVFVSSNAAWTAEPRSKWLSVDRTSGKGDLSVRISYEKNDTEKRTGIVRFTAEGVNPVEVTITQSALTFTNPITLGGNIATMPDPYIVRDGEYYYTCKASGNGIAISRSTRLTVINSTSGLPSCSTSATAGTYTTPQDAADRTESPATARSAAAYSARRPTTRWANGKTWACSTPETTTSPASNPRWKTRNTPST